MSIAQAKGIVRSLRWYHLGFCFFWAITFTALSNPSGQFGGGYEAYSTIKQATTLVALCVAAAWSRRHPVFPPHAAIGAGVVLSAGSLLYYLAFFYGSYSLMSALVSGVLVGGAVGAFYVMWQSFYASEGSSRTTVYIPLSAAVSVVLCVLVTVVPFEWTVLCAVVVLPSCAVYTLYVSLREVEPYETEPMTPARSRMLVRDMWKPVFCVCAIGFVWRLVGHLSGDSSETAFVAIMAGMSVATLTVSAIELFSDKGFDVLRVYQVLFPVVTGAFLLPTFLGPTWLPVASAFTMFGFEVVNLLLLITCAVYASRFAMHSSLLYAACVGPTLLSLLIGDLVGQWLDRSMLYDLTFVVDILFVCIYVLAVAMFVISVGRGRRRDAQGADASVHEEREAIGADTHTEASLIANAAHTQEPVASEKEESVEWAERIEGEDANSTGAASPKPKKRSRRAAAQKGDVRQGSASAHGSAAPTDEAHLSDVFESNLAERLAALNLVEPLSPRETEVVSLMLRGNTVPAIARKLFISENTVRGHTKAIYRKLGVHSKQELIDLLG